MFSSEKDNRRFWEMSDQLPETKNGDPLSSNRRHGVFPLLRSLNIVWTYRAAVVSTQAGEVIRHRCVHVHGEAEVARGNVCQGGGVGHLTGQSHRVIPDLRIANKLK
jgi:hypothetical protein